MVINWLEPGIVTGITVIVTSMVFVALAVGFYTLATFQPQPTIEIRLWP